MDVFEVILWWLLVAVPAVALGAWIYCRVFMSRRIDIHGGRRQAIVAGFAAAVWLANFFVPVSYGDGETYDVKLALGLLQYHDGELVSWVCVHNVYYYEFAEGLTLRTHCQMSYALPRNCGLFTAWLGFLVPMYRHHGTGFAWHVPMWPLVAVPIARFFVEAYRRRRLVKHNPCPTCRYILTGCRVRWPECGARI